MSQQREASSGRAPGEACNRALYATVTQVRIRFQLPCVFPRVRVGTHAGLSTVVLLLRLRSTRSAGPVLRSRVDQTHSHRTTACEATGCGMPARPSARAFRRRTGPQAASREGGVGGNEQYAVCAPGCHDATQSPGRACVQNQRPCTQVLSACAPPARQPALQPALTPKSTYAAQNRLPRMGHGSTVFMEERVHEGGK